MKFLHVFSVCCFLLNGLANALAEAIQSGSIYCKEANQFSLIDKIVIDAKAHQITKLAADEAARYLSLAPVETSDNPVNINNALIIGRLGRERYPEEFEKELEKTANGGYAIMIKNGNVILDAKIAYYHLAGIRRFFEKFGGKIYVPPEVFSVPEKIELQQGWTEIPRFLASDAIYLAPNMYGSYSMQGDPRKLSWAAEYYRNIWVVHTSDLLVPYKIYGKTHPEYYALLPNGKRLSFADKHDSHAIHLCLSNPDVQRIAAENTLKWIDAQPEYPYFSISQGDGSNWCTCENCRQMDVPGHGTTDRMATFVNVIAKEVKKRYPEKRLLFSAYMQALPAPGKVTLEDNIIVKIAPDPAGGMRSQNHPLDDSSWVNRKGFDAYTDWSKMNVPMIVGTYTLVYGSRLVPLANFNSHLGSNRLYAQNKNVIGVFYCEYPSQFSGMFKYVTRLLEWNPSLDATEVMKDFANTYYGKAGPAMIDFIHLFNARANEPFYLSCVQYFPSIGLCMNGFGEKAFGIFDQAQKTVDGDQLLESRVQKEKMGMLFVYLSDCNPYSDPECNLEVFAQRLKEFLQIMQNEKANKRLFAKCDNHWIKKNSGLNFKTDIYSDPVFLDFLKCESPLDFLLQHTDVKTAKITPAGAIVPATRFGGGNIETAIDDEVFGADAKNSKIVVIDAHKSISTDFEILNLIFDRIFIHWKAENAQSGLEMTINGKKLTADDKNAIRSQINTDTFPIPPALLTSSNKVIITNPSEAAVKIHLVKFLCRPEEK